MFINEQDDAAPNTRRTGEVGHNFNMEGNFYVRNRLPYIKKELVFKPSALTVRQKADKNLAMGQERNMAASQARAILEESFDTFRNLEASQQSL